VTSPDASAEATARPASWPTVVSTATTAPPGAWQPVVIELADPVRDVPTRGAAALHVTALWQGQPLGTAVVEAPVDPYPAGRLATVLAQHFGGALADLRMETLLSDSVPRPQALSGTVVVCTRDRSASLQRCLGSLATLAPGDPVDVLVVDNGDGDAETRQLVEGYGFRWVHEPLPGLARARNRGLMEASGDVVLFADDDVYVSPIWARALLACFDDPLVGAATGLVLPAVLDTAEQRTFEEHFGFGRGRHRRVVDGALQAPMGAGSLGAGASMAFRRDLMLGVGGFPELLDSGMPTRGGGDTYGIYRVLRAGRRAVFEPRALSLHWHREGAAELVRTVTSYSIGTYSFLFHALLHDRDLLALREMASWSVRWVAGRLVRSALRRKNAPPVSLAWADLLGALQAPRAFLGAGRIVRRRGELLSADGRSPSPRPLPGRRFDTVASAPEASPSVSVVIPTRNRRDQVVDLLRALDRQVTPPSEVAVVVDGDVDGTAAAVRGLGLTIPVRLVVHVVNRGAAVARNSGVEASTGEILLFLDDDVIPVDADLVAEHAAAHRAHGSPVTVVGPCLPGDVSAERPFLLGVRNWWVDHVGRLSTGQPLSFTDLGTGNFSIARASLEAVGGFRELPRREDWELGYRLQRSDIGLVAAPAAAVLHPIDVELDGLLHDRIEEGAGDFRFAQDHADVIHHLPVWRWVDMTPTQHAMVTGLFLAPHLGERALRPMRALMAGLDRLGARTRFHQRLGQALFIAYWTGVARAAGSETALLETLSRSPAWAGSRPAPTASLDLGRRPWAPIDPTAVEVQLTLEGRHIATVPSNWGGFPWSSGEFSRRLQAALTTERLAAVLEERGA
jgi:glycosyltransferase involved in cell wall biosynthesis